jgi:predicted membrane channel-forming protein YqfA (hemolysin III family)
MTSFFIIMFIGLFIISSLYHFIQVKREQKRES